MNQYFLGVDGGQSSTTAIIADETGRVLSIGTGGPCYEVESAIFGALKDNAHLHFRAVCMGFSGGPKDKADLVRKLISADEYSITNDGIKRLRSAGYWIEDEKFRGQHLFGIRLPKGRLIDTVREKLKRKKISVSVRGNSLRVSPNVYNSQADFEKLVKVLLD